MKESVEETVVYIYQNALVQTKHQEPSTKLKSVIYINLSIYNYVIKLIGI